MGQFVQRHKKQLKTLYLHNINNLRTKTEYAPMFKYFYNLVGFFCTFSLSLYAIELTFMLTFIKLITGIEKYNITTDNLRDSWIEDLDEEEEAYFAASKNGWSYDTLDL